MHLVGVNAFVYDSWFFFIGGYGQIASIIVYSWESGYLYDIIFVSFVLVDKSGSRFCQTDLPMRRKVQPLILVRMLQDGSSRGLRCTGTIVNVPQ